MYRRYFVCREARREPGQITDERLGEMIIDALISRLAEKLRQQGVEIDAPNGRRKLT